MESGEDAGEVNPEQCYDDREEAYQDQYAVGSGVFASEHVTKM